MARTSSTPGSVSLRMGAEQISSRMSGSLGASAVRTDMMQGVGRVIGDDEF